MQKRGFTFIEAIITMAILLMLTSMLLLYNRTGEKQIVLLREKSNVVGQILKARSLSINTFIQDEPICGYGVHFENDSYSLFRDRATDCLASDKTYTSADSQELVEKFILPTGSRLASLFHVARSVCRRAEREVVALMQKEKINEAILVYLNRLSDLLFIMARLANKKENVTDKEWITGT